MTGFLSRRAGAIAESLLASAAAVLAISLLGTSGVSLPYGTGLLHAGTASIAGVAFTDVNGDGVWQADEALLPGHHIYLFDGDGDYVDSAATDIAGAYAFEGLSDGTYGVRYSASSWWDLRESWVPTTTGSLHPQISVTVPDQGRADFGWRPLVKSTDLTKPVAEYLGPTGLRVAVYNDAVQPVAIHDAVMSGLVGPEAEFVTVRFGYSSNSTTSATIGATDGRYTSFRAVSYVSYVSWLDTADRALSHEYGHAWSLYNGYIVQQDPNLTGYLIARGLDGDPRVGTSYAWSTREMIAEDYRQLFGSETARHGGQANGDIPSPSDVLGLREYLAGAFAGNGSGSPAPSDAPPSMEPTPAPAPTSSPENTPPPSQTEDPAPTLGPTPAPSPAGLNIAGLTITPQPVRAKAEARFRLTIPARVSVQVLDARGSLIRTLVASRDFGAGDVSIVWDRRDDNGRRVKTGTYVIRVHAIAPDAQQDQASASFTAN